MIAMEAKTARGTLRRGSPACPARAAESSQPVNRQTATGKPAARARRRRPRPAPAGGLLGSAKGAGSSLLTAGPPDALASARASLLTCPFHSSDQARVRCPADAGKHWMKWVIPRPHGEPRTPPTGPLSSAERSLRARAPDDHVTVSLPPSPLPGPKIENIVQAGIREGGRLGPVGSPHPPASDAVIGLDALTSSRSHGPTRLRRTSLGPAWSRKAACGRWMGQPARPAEDRRSRRPARRD